MHGQPTSAGTFKETPTCEREVSRRRILHLGSLIFSSVAVSTTMLPQASTAASTDADEKKKLYGKKLYENREMEEELMEDVGQELADLESRLESDEAAGKISPVLGEKIEQEVEELEVLAAAVEERGPAPFGQGPQPSISRRGIEKKIAKVREEVPL